MYTNSFMHIIVLFTSQQVILPFFLLFGRSPRLPIDVISDLEDETGAKSHAEYVTKWKSAMQEAYSLASKSATKSSMRGKRNYDKRMRSSALQMGDRVLVRNLTPRGGPGKLRSFWEDKIHVVVARKGEGSPVYDVRPESSEGPSRTLHRNLLLPCDYLPGKPWEDPPPIKRTTPYHCHEIQPLRHEDDSHESDSDDDLPAISYCNHSPENDPMQTQVQSTSEETVGEEPDFTHVHSGEVSSELCTGANIADTPDEAQLNEDPQVVSGEVDIREGTNNSGRPQRVRQAPKRLTYDSPGAPTYVRPINVNPSGGTQQCGMQTSPALHSQTSSGPVQYPATSLELYSSTGTTYDVLEPEHDVALYGALSSRTAVTTMGSVFSVVSVQINSDFFFCPLPCKKKREISLVYFNIRCVDAVNAILR